MMASYHTFTVLSCLALRKLFEQKNSHNRLILLSLRHILSQQFHFKFQFIFRYIECNHSKGGI